MAIIRVSLALLCLMVGGLSATTWNVGPGRVHNVPSAVASLVQDGDTVVIDAAEYSGDVCSWRADRLLLQGVGPVILKAAGKAAEQKAIWVIKGDDCVVDGIDFRDCAVPDRNGAGIRVEGTNITVQRCAFRNNQDGILAGDNANSTIVVEYSEFDNSGAGDGLSHAIYVNHVGQFIFRYNYSHGTKVGHEFKSRAFKNDILYNRISSESGTGSRNIDLPNGGRSVIMGNIIQKGPNTENGNLVGYGLEGLSDTVDNSLYVAYNTFVNERSSATFFRLDPGTKRFRLVDNILAGPGTVLIGTADSLDTLNNLRRPVVADVRFADAASLNYQLLDESPARMIAVDAGWYMDWGLGDDILELPLTPSFSYVHPSYSVPRYAQRDMGAFENEVLGSVNGEQPLHGEVHVFPNPANDMVTVNVPVEVITEPIVISDMTGRTLMTIHGTTPTRNIDVSMLVAGRYGIACGSVRQQLLIAR